jgi:hypothetical protein
VEGTPATSTPSPTLASPQFISPSLPSHAWASPSPHTVNLQPLSPSPSLKP